MPKCFICNEEVIWGSDFSYEEVHGEDIEGVVSFFTCPNCGAEYEVTQRFEEEA
jgi:uncharacterized protein with PIN domain